jgi:hypothetical protein
MKNAYFRLWILGTAGLLLAPGGCTLLGKPGVAQSRGGPSVDRLVAAYEDLAFKKFQVIADFESPAQAGLFRCDPAGGTGRVEISTKQARRETGVGALRMALQDSSQQVVAEDRPESEWSLLRDWTPFQLLIFSVYSPRPLSGFTYSVRSGTDVPLTFTHPRIALEKGWNLIRADLGEMSDQVNLADVRELRFWCDPLESPAELYLDDVILTNNSRQVFGPAQPAPGELYVRAQGQRLVVGAGERFEVVFSEGLIRQWYDLSSDPAKARSLTGGLPLGPAAVTLPKLPDPAGWLDEVLGQTKPPAHVNVLQTVEETTPLGVRIRATWRADTGETPREAAPALRECVYSVYRDGRIFVELAGKMPEAGVACFCDADAGFKLTLVEHAAEAAPGGAHDPYALFARAERGRADLLVVPYGAYSGQTLNRPDDPRLCVLWRPVSGDEQLRFAAMMRVWPTDIDAPTQAVPMAADYRQPMPLLVDAGSLNRAEPGDFDTDGFSEGRGCFVLQLDGNVAKARISGRRYLRFAPLFKLVNVADRDVWVYVDGRQVETYRDSKGNALFEVPGLISGEALVEVTSRAKEKK